METSADCRIDQRNDYAGIFGNQGFTMEDQRQKCGMGEGEAEPCGSLSIEV